MLLIGVSGMAQSERETTEDPIVRQIVVRTTGEDLLYRLLEEQPELSLVRAIYPGEPIYLLATATERELAIGRLSQYPGVVYAHANRRVESRMEPNDPLYGDQIGLQRIGAPRAWEFSTGGVASDGSEIVIALFDDGLDITHNDLDGNLYLNPGEVAGNGIDDDNNGFVDDVVGWNFINNTPNHFLDFDEHGTRVAGILGARGDNGAFGTGVNWRTKILPFTVETFDQIAAASLYVRDLRRRWNETGGAEGAFVVVGNYSLGIDRLSCTEAAVWRDVMDPLGEAGILTVGATSNDPENDVDQNGDVPTSCPSEYLISVTATGRRDERLTAFGPNSIDLAAPGSGIVTIGHNNTPGSISGTSAATPFVSGAVALLYAMPGSTIVEQARENPAATARAVRDFIFDSVEPLSSLEGQTTTGGLLDLARATEFAHAFSVASDRSSDYVQQLVQGEDVLKIFPVPARDVVTIEYATRDFASINLEIYDASGRLLARELAKTIPFEQQSLELDVSGYAHGVYWVTITGTEEPKSRRFVVIR